jgi:hypothetical protein
VGPTHGAPLVKGMARIKLDEGTGVRLEVGQRVLVVNEDGRQLARVRFMEQKGVRPLAASFGN